MSYFTVAKYLHSVFVELKLQSQSGIQEPRILVTADSIILTADRVNLLALSAEAS
jgi:hypothetical protein